MSDRVRFLTWNDTGTPANSSGCNGFPTPYLAAGGALFPAIVPYPQIVSWFWRNRLFSISSTDLSLTAGALSGSVTTGDMTGGQLNAAGSSMTSEMQHVARGASGPRTSGVWAGNGDATGDASLNIFLDGVNDCPAIYFDGTDYLPAFAITGALIVDDLGGNAIALNFSTDSGSVGGTPDGSFPFTFDGVTMTMYHKASASGDGAFTFSSLVIAASTSANSYWPYKGADGNPIYDDATGAQIQDPGN